MLVLKTGVCANGINILRASCMIPITFAYVDLGPKKHWANAENSTQLKPAWQERGPKPQTPASHVRSPQVSSHTRPWLVCGCRSQFSNTLSLALHRNGLEPSSAHSPQQTEGFFKVKRPGFCRRYEFLNQPSV